ncbi:hypothetical protein ACOSP7_024218 [Xanthoceras sorbifolium]
MQDVYIIGNPTQSPTEWGPITFSPLDLEGVKCPHCDALVISIMVFNRTVKSVLVYHGSSADIIHWSMVEQLRYKIEQLQPTRYCIRGISGQSTRPLGEVDLPVRFGSRPAVHTLWITFQVVDIPFPFNILIGRPTLYNLKTVSSLYCMKIKFPTEDEE